MNPQFWFFTYLSAHSFVQCDQWFHNVKMFLSLLFLERKVCMSTIHIPMFIFFVFDLAWSLNTSVGKNQLQFVYLRASVSVFLVQIKYFLQLGFVFCQNPQKKRTKANRKKINTDRYFFKDVICIFWCYSVCNLIVGRAAPIIRKNCHSHLFHPFPLRPQNEEFYVFHQHLFIRTPLPACPPSSVPTPILINRIFSWKSQLSHAGVHITHFFSRYQIFYSKTPKSITGSVLWNQ